MKNIPNYLILGQIYESANSLVYRAIREQDKKAVILKFLKEDYPIPSELTRYKQEYQITRNLNVEGVIKAYSLEPYQRTLVIILEDFGASSLTLLMNDKNAGKGICAFSLEEFFRIAIKTAEILGRIHAAGVIHKDINPSNIVLNPSTEELKIIDFGISTTFTRENPTLKNPNLLEGTLGYISPEQTGRMNRSLDYRTDFYSLGVTFYELLTGQLPFETNDALELVHYHIAKQPILPHHIKPEIPEVVSRIVMKLMAKTAEERYQTAWGIKADLEECLSQLQTQGFISSFSLASQDISDLLQITQKLYGRDTEVETLLRAFERIAGENPKSEIQNPKSEIQNPKSKIEMMLVAGYSGIGKSVLVQELYKPITAKRGYFISGKFDQFQRNIPYSAVVGAFKELLKQILTESEKELNQWREKLLTALGANGQVIIDVIPEVELIVGKQPAVPSLGSTESQNRFNLVFQNFIRVFCTKEHPLVIFLDDLQWADSASLKLIELMMTDIDTQYLFLIGAYRDNEVKSTHPLMMTVDRLLKVGATINSIILAPLALEHITQLIADTLHSDIASVKPLAELVNGKTEGNPFFVNEFLKTLYTENLIRFELSSNRKWTWNISQIEAKSITDNVVDLMTAKINKLPEFTQKALHLAACVGASFDLNTLAIVCEKLPVEVYQDLTAALRSGLILPASELDTELLIQNYKFLHDRVQQAAYALIDEAQKQAVHLQIGRLLLQNTPDEALLEEIFEIVDHLNLAVELVTHQQERLKIAKLNLMAGQKAKTAAAYGAAVGYLKAGIKLLLPDSWQTSYQLTLALYEEAAEAAYVNGDFEQMQLWAEVVLQQAKTLLDKVKVYEVKIQTCMAQSKQLEAIEIGLQALDLMGIEFPEQPNMSDVQLALSETASHLTGKEPSDLINLPEMTDPYKLASMKLLASIVPAAYQVGSTLFVLIVLQQVNLSVKYGNSPLSAFSYVCYAIVLCAVVGDIEAGYQLGQLSLNLLSRFNSKALKAKISQPFNNYVRHWKAHVRTTLKSLLEDFSSGIENGDLEFTALSASTYCHNIYFIGKELFSVEQEMTNYCSFVEQIKQKVSLNYINICRQSVLNLLGQSESPCILIGKAYNEETMLRLHQLGNDRYAIGSVYINKLILCYLFGAYPQAVENAAIANQYLDGVRGVLLVSMFHFYDSLAWLAVYADAAAPEQKGIFDKVQADREMMQKWAHYAPMNFLHKFYLMEAERYRVLGQHMEAMDYYDKAIAGAKENEYINEEALAYELAAKFYMALGKEIIARTYMSEAYYTYTRWGALAKVKDLETKYPQLLTNSLSRPNITSISTINNRISTSSHSGSALDLATVIKAFQAISGEIVLDKLLRALMKIIIENAGAQVGYLILENDNKLFIEAEGLVDSDRVTVLRSLPVESSNSVSLSIINYVARSSETVVLDNAACEGNFTNDPYIKAHQPKSILCLPLINQAKLTSIVYLENNLATGAFTRDRIEILKVLSSQAAISIENARLYANLAEYNQTLETKVEERTAELAIAKQKAEAAAEAKSSFLANMSHELRSPLNAILGFAQLMIRSSSLAPEYQEKARIIHRSGEHLLTLINDVLDMAKIESGRTTLNETAFNLTAVLNDLRDMFYLKAQEKRLRFMVDRSPDIPQTAIADEVKLRQVLINLLSNAFKFTSSGSINLRSRAKVEGKIVNLYFEVEDTGCGIARDELDSIFQPFVQTKSGQKVKGGTGLGLSISRHFVQLMGGEMTVESQVGEGTTFKFNIQCQQGETAESETSERIKPVIVLPPDRNSYRILIADDRPENRQLLVEMLQPLALELREASNGMEAVQIWENWQPDLIFMDVQMPVINGYAAAQQIRAQESQKVKGENLKSVKIVAVSASSFETGRETARRAAYDDFMSKPFTETDIFEIISKYLGVLSVYDESGLGTASTELDFNVQIPAALAALPADLMLRLEQATIRLDSSSINRIIEEIYTLDRALAEALKALVDDFSHSSILDLIAEAKFQK